MSFDINWETIYTDEGLRASLKDFLNEKLTSIDLPKYMKDLQIVEVNLGSKSPRLTIRDIDYPFAEFYQQDDTEFDQNSANMPNRPDKDNRNRSQSITNAEQRKRKHAVLKPQVVKKTVSESSYPLRSAGLRTSSPIGIHSTADLFMPCPGSPYLPGLHNGVGIGAFGAREGDAGSQNGSLGSSIEPNVSIDGIQSEEAGIKAPLETLQANPMASQESRSAAEQNTGPEVRTDGKNERNSTGKGENDIQFTLDLEWGSNIYVEVTCSLMVNYPSPGFITLPVRLKISDLTIHSLAVLAYLKHRVFVSFLCDLDEDFDAADADPLKATRRSTVTDASTADGFLNTEDLGSESGNRVDIIKNMKIEGELCDYRESVGTPSESRSNSRGPKQQNGEINTGPRTRSYTNEINHHRMYSSSLSEKERLTLQSWSASMTDKEGANGVDGTGNGSVLRNIGKIEKFLLSALRKVLVNELAWPSWIEIDMDEDEEEE